MTKTDKNNDLVKKSSKIFLLLTSTCFFVVGYQLLESNSGLGSSINRTVKNSVILAFNQYPEPKHSQNTIQHTVQNSQKPIRQNSPIEFYEKKSEPNHVPYVHKPEFPPYISPELQSEPPVKYGQNDFFTQRESGKELKAAFFLNENPKSSEPTILFWNNPWLGFPPRPYDLCGPDFTCNVVTSKAPDDLRKADAVIIHPVFTFLKSQLGDAWKDMFSGYRSARQLYLFFQWEAPEFHAENYQKFNNFFNATITYRQDSSFFFPYDSIIGLKLRALFEKKTRSKLNLGNITETTINQILANKNPLESQQILDNNFSNIPRREKKFGVASVVSNCKSPYRSATIKHLDKLLRMPDGTPALNYMGRCNLLDKAGNARGNQVYKKFKSGSGFAGLYGLAMRHKFFLSIENSRCRYYITEKFFENALLAGTVPIVAGAPRRDYEMVAPKKSFIHIDDFSSLEGLAGYVNYLLLNETAYNEYFDWWKPTIDSKGEKDDDFGMRTVEDYKNSGFCKLCTVLKKSKAGQGRHWPVIENFQRYWYGSDTGTNYDTTCRQVRGEGVNKIRWRRGVRNDSDAILSDLFY